MRKVLLLTLVIGVCSFNKALALAPPMTGTYSINSAVATGGTNFQTFSEAALALQSGISTAVVFNVVAGSGPYNEQIVLGVIPGTSTTNTVTFNCNGVTLTYNSTNASQPAGVKLEGTHHVIFDKLTVIPQVTTLFEYGEGFRLMQDADSNIIRNCTIINNFHDPVPQLTNGIVITSTNDLYAENGTSRCDYNIITGNTITGGYYGIIVSNWNTITSTPNVTIDNNQVTNNIIKDFWYIGIEVMLTNKILIEGNDITCNSLNYMSVGIQLNEANYSAIVRGNRIHEFRINPLSVQGIGWRDGIELAYCVAAPGRENVVCNNLVYDFESPEELRGIHIDGTTSYANVFHNTVSFDNAAGTGTIYTGMYLEGTNVKYLKIENNILSATAGGTGSKTALNAEGPVSTFFDHNDYWASAATGTVRMVRYKNTTYNSLATLQPVILGDYHSQNIDPLFTNIATANYLPTAAGIDNHGVYVNVDKDIVGTARNTTTPDIGAYEHTSPGCNTSPTSGTTVILPGTSVCVNTLVALDLNGNSNGSGQTYQWQSSSAPAGTYANVGSVQNGPGIDITAGATLYYRAQVTCGGNTVTSNPIQLVVTPYLPAGTYTINSAQLTGGTNFQRFGDAVLAMQCGIAGPVVFNVVKGSGPYTEQVIIPAIPNTSKTNTITFNGNGEILKYTSTVTGQRAVLKLDGTDYTTIDGLNIQATGATASEYGYCVHLINDADNNIIRNCTMTASVSATSLTNFAGVVISSSHTSATGSAATNCDSNLVANNTITGGNYGVCVTTGDPYPIYKNIISGNTIKESAAYGVYSTGTDSLVVEGNDISRPTRNNTASFTGIQMGAVAKGFVVNKNKIHNFSGGMLTTSGTAYGIFVTGADATAAKPSLVTNNLIYDFNGNTTQTGLYNSSSDYVYFYHNTVSMDDSSFTGAKVSYGFYQNSDATGVDIKNNLFTMRRTNTSVSYAMYQRTSGTVYTSDYNDFLLGSTGFTKMGYFSGTGYNALTDWQAAYPQEAHSLILNPAYEAPGTGNFKPSSTTLNDKGTPVGIKDDILNTTRSTTKPDIGAYEFGCSTFPAAPVVKDSIAVCAGSPVTFQINTPEAGVTYNWYTTASGTTIAFTGNNYTVNNVTTQVDYWVQGFTATGCTNGTRTHVKAVAYTTLSAPVAVVDTIGVDMVRFKWAAVPGAVGYQVSRDGINFSIPSSGATGLTHTIAALRPLDTVSLVVKAVGVITCQDAVSARVSARTRNNEFFIPNTFTPNGDGRNDVFIVYGNTIKSIKVMVFNQWGEKVFESASQATGWDGSYKGKQQPIGVYMYVINIVLNDGSVFVKKGSLNLVR